MNETNNRHASSAADEPGSEDEAAIQEPYETSRPRGRQVPPRARQLVEIIIDSEIVGTVNPAELTVGAQLDLEDCKKTRELIGWLVRHAGADAAQVEALLRPMPLQAILDLAIDIGDALGRAIAVPKRNARR